LENPSPVESPTQQPTQNDSEHTDPAQSPRSTDGHSEFPQDNVPLLSTDRGKQENGEGPTFVSEHYHIPSDLRNEHLWVVWDGEHKRALAPWQEGSMYPCEWAETKECNPRRSFETAQMVAELSVEQIHESWPFPESTELPAEVLPAVLLPHHPTESPVTFVDFDNVRDPETGEITNEVAQLVNALNGYTEVSRTGTGLHVYVKGGLPERMGMFCGELAQGGNIEIYDHGRFTGGTWQHVTGTPKDALPDAEGTISSVIARYTPAAECAQ
jgi:hypothetical protein